MEDYFGEKQHQCKCGCGSWNMDKVHLFMLNQARELAGIPFVVTSGTRCEKHNLAVGGLPDSEHLDGYATDLYAPDSVYRFVVVRALFVVGFRRIGLSKEEYFVHVGSDPSKPQKVLFIY